MVDRDEKPALIAFQLSDWDAGHMEAACAGVKPDVFHISLSRRLPTFVF
jgi:hypothetical protein